MKKIRKTMAILIVAVLTMMLMPASVFADYLGRLTLNFNFTGIPEGQTVRVIVGNREYYCGNGPSPTYSNIDASSVWVLPFYEDSVISALQSLNQYPNVVRVDNIDGYDKRVTVTVNSLDNSTHNANVTYNVAYTRTPPGITINRDSSYSGEQGSKATYTVYKIFSADILSDPTVGANGVTTTQGTANYYVTSQNQANGIANNTDMAAIFNLTPAATDARADRWYVTLKNSDTSADTIAVAMNSLISDAAYGSYFPATATKDMTGSTLTFGNADGITAGYYLIKSDLGTNLAVQTLSPVTINEKNTYPTVDKEVAGSDESAQIGDIVTFTVELEVPDGADKAITITDTYTDGLTPIVAQNTDAAGAYYVDFSATPSTVGQVYITAVDDSDTPVTVLGFTSSNPSNGTFTINLTQAQVEALKGKTVTFTYCAIINSSAVVQKANENTNKVKLDYGQDYTSTEDTVDVETQRIKLTKYDGDDANKTPIAGAIFELRDSNDNVVPLVYVSDTIYRVAMESEIIGTTKSFYNGDTNPAANDVYRDVLTVAGTGNDILVNGLDANVTYSWYELKAPTDYNPLGAATTVTPSTSNVVASEIANNQGATLPSTGGIGTTIFYIIGAILVIGGGIVLVTRRRMG